MEKGKNNHQKFLALQQQGCLYPFGHLPSGCMILCYDNHSTPGTPNLAFLTISQKTLVSGCSWMVTLQGELLPTLPGKAQWLSSS